MFKSIERLAWATCPGIVIALLLMGCYVVLIGERPNKREQVRAVLDKRAAEFAMLMTSAEQAEETEEKAAKQAEQEEPEEKKAPPAWEYKFGISDIVYHKVDNRRMIVFNRKQRLHEYGSNYGYYGCRYALPTAGQTEEPVGRVWSADPRMPIRSVAVGYAFEWFAEYELAAEPVSYAESAEEAEP